MLFDYMLEDLILATYSAWIAWKPNLNEKNKKSPYCTVEMHVSAYDLSTENLKKLFPNFTCFLTLTIIIKETIPQSSSPPFLSYFKILLSIFHSESIFWCFISSFNVYLLHFQRKLYESRDIVTFPPVSLVPSTGPGLW